MKCANCGFTVERLRKGRCDPCYRFWIRHGRTKDRSRWKAARARYLRMVRECEARDCADLLARQGA